MRTSSNQLQDQSVALNLIHQQPIRLNVTLSHVFVIFRIGQRMISVGRRQRLLLAQQFHDSTQLLRIAATLHRQLIVFLELPRKLRFKH